jgi:hypothetical protein
VLLLQRYNVLINSKGIKLKKVIIFLLTFYLFFSGSVKAETLKGGIEKVWTVDSAREEAFKNLKPCLDLSWAPPIDPNLIENKQAMNNHQKKINNRYIIIFNDGFYGIKIEDENNYDKAYYYFPSGELGAIDFVKYNVECDFENYKSKTSRFPAKVYKHVYPGGRLISVGILINTNETYMFKPSGELYAHWIGDNCYDTKGNIISKEIEIKEQKYEY